jgi:hypothetical protein
MRSKMSWVVSGLLAAVLGLALVGCATGPSSAPGKSQADLLRDAGFKMYTATAPGHQAYVSALPATKVVSNRYQGQVLYLVCTDPGSKRCFLGDEAAYMRYRQMAVQQNLSEDMQNISEDRADPEALQMWVNSQGGG